MRNGKFISQLAFARSLARGVFFVELLINTLNVVLLNAAEVTSAIAPPLSYV